MAHKPKTGDDARPRGSRVGLSLREAQAMRKKFGEMVERVERLEAKLAHYSDGMTDIQFVDHVVATMCANGGRGLPKAYQADAWVEEALDMRRALREKILEKTEAAV